MSYTYPSQNIFGSAVEGGVILGGAYLGGRARHHARAPRHHAAHHATPAKMERQAVKAAVKHESKEQLAHMLPAREILKLVPKGKLEKKVVSKELRHRK